MKSCIFSSQASVQVWNFAGVFEIWKSCTPQQPKRLAKLQGSPTGKYARFRQQVGRTAQVPKFSASAGRTEALSQNLVQALATFW